MRAVNNIIDQIKLDEGVIPYAYQDTLGFWTIGVGFLIDKRKGSGLDNEEIDFILQHRVGMKQAEILERWPPFARLDPVRQGALTNMAYQMGVSGVLAFKDMLAALIAQNWAAAHDAALESHWAQQTPERAQRIATQLLTGDWQ